jgi:hypothetical protein
MIRRMMLIEASCPSKRLDAVTMRTGLVGTWSSGLACWVIDDSSGWLFRK